MITEARQHYLAGYESLRDRLEKLGTDRVRRLRRSAIERFAEIGFPTPKNEEWKFTKLAPLLALPFEPAPRNGVDLEGLRPLVAGFTGIRLVFVNGHFASGAVVKDPIQLVFISTSARRMSSPRILIVAGPEAQATVVEAYLAGSDEPYFTNAVCEVVQYGSSDPAR